MLRFWKKKELMASSEPKNDSVPNASAAIRSMRDDESKIKKLVMSSKTAPTIRMCIESEVRNTSTDDLVQNSSKHNLLSTQSHFFDTRNSCTPRGSVSPLTRSVSCDLRKSNAFLPTLSMIDSEGLNLKQLGNNKRQISPRTSRRTKSARSLTSSLRNLSFNIHFDEPPPEKLHKISAEFRSR